MTGKVMHSCLSFIWKQKRIPTTIKPKGTVGENKVACKPYLWFVQHTCPILAILHQSWPKSCLFHCLSSPPVPACRLRQQLPALLDLSVFISPSSGPPYYRGHYNPSQLSIILSPIAQNFPVAPPVSSGEQGFSCFVWPSEPFTNLASFHSYHVLCPLATGTACHSLNVSHTLVALLLLFPKSSPILSYHIPSLWKSYVFLWWPKGSVSSSISPG